MKKTSGCITAEIVCEPLKSPKNSEKYWVSEARKKAELLCLKYGVTLEELYPYKDNISASFYSIEGTLYNWSLEKHYLDRVYLDISDMFFGSRQLTPWSKVLPL